MITKKNLVFLLAVFASFLAIQGTMAQTSSRIEQAKKLESQIISANQGIMPPSLSADEVQEIENKK